MLEKASAPNIQPRVAVLGVGNELNGDDAAGVLTARLLIKKIAKLRVDTPGLGMRSTKPMSVERLLVVEAGLGPENFTGALRKFQPDIVILIDAAWLDEDTGTIVWVEGIPLTGFGASTHLQPLSTLKEYLVEELGCQLYMIGIQPEHLDFDRPISTKVHGACRRLADGLSDLLLGNSNLL